MVLIVIPTYNEKDSIAPLIEKIFTLPITKTQILVVDDNSPDGTGNIAESLAKKYPVRVMHRAHKTGLGDAYRDAWRQIMREGTPYEYIIHMDADGSHDPTVIPKMLQEMQHADLVIGSRYIKGGVIENWNIVRRILSRSANFFVRNVLRLPYKDMTGGFRCYTRNAFQKMDFASVSATGYSFLIETLYQAYQKGLRIREIPIAFTERKRGASKLNVPRYIFEVFWKVIKLRLKQK